VVLVAPQRLSYSRRRLLSFEEIAGANVLPTRSCSSLGDQNVGKSSHGSDSTYLQGNISQHSPAVTACLVGSLFETCKNPVTSSEEGKIDSKGEERKGETYSVKGL